MKNRNSERKDIRTIRTKHLLEKSLYQLLETIPFDKITIQEICDNASVHRTTYYQHFNNKEELLEYSLNNFREKLFEVTNKNINDCSIKEMFLHLSHFFITYVQGNRDVIKKIINNIGSEFLIAKVSYAYEQSILVMLNKYDVEFSVPTPIISQFFTGGLMRILLSWLESPEPVSRNELLNYIDIVITSVDSENSEK